MAEVQDGSGSRLLPMAIMPAWDIDGCVAEAQRCAAMGFRGVNMTADPQDSGSPDLGDRRWDPFWEVCEDLELPVHFHIGSSDSAFAYWGTTFWPSQDDSIKPAIGGASLFQNNSRVLLNSAYSGMFDRFPSLKMVSVESGIGWVPFILEAMDHELQENAPEYFAKLAKPPSQYFRDNWYATLWFESGHGSSRASSEPSARTTSCSRPTFPTPPACTRTPSRWRRSSSLPGRRDDAQDHGGERGEPLPDLGARRGGWP